MKGVGPNRGLARDVIRIIKAEVATQGVFMRGQGGH